MRPIPILLFWLPLFVFVGCNVGTGEGEVGGVVQAPGCGISGVGDVYEMNPTFFAGEVVLERYVIRVQSISDFEDKSDGIIIDVANAARVQQEYLGVPMPVGNENADVPIRAVFYANESCKIARRETPVSYDAVEGMITFSQIYAPRISDAGDTVAMFEARFVDRESPDERFAELRGQFSFAYSRGRPAQRFP